MCIVAMSNKLYTGISSKLSDSSVFGVSRVPYG